MTTVTVHEAKTHLSRLIKEALAGEEVTITRGRSGEELVKIVSAKPKTERRIPGRFAHLKGSKGVLDYGFWDPVNEDELALWNGEEPSE